MTDEELVAEYLKDDSKYLIEDAEGNLINITKKVREAFLAGLKAKSTSWHYIADNDLPPVNLIVLDEQCNKIAYIGEDKWEAYSEYYEGYVDVDPPIAWCKQPEFKEVSK